VHPRENSGYACAPVCVIRLLFGHQKFLVRPKTDKNTNIGSSSLVDALAPFAEQQQQPNLIGLVTLTEVEVE